MVHEVKVLPEYFSALECGDKTFEVRKKDRLYAVGDCLAVNEFIPDKHWDPYSSVPGSFRQTNDGYYTGNCLIFLITYILNDPEYCAEGTVILGLRKVDFASDCKNKEGK